MAVAFNASSGVGYDLTGGGTTASVAIDASGSDRLIVVHWGSARGALRTLTAISLNSVAADYYENLGIDGGTSATGGFAYWLDANNPGNGTWTLSVTWSGSQSYPQVIVTEYTGVHQTTAIGTRKTNTTTNLADGGNIACPAITGESGEFVISWVSFSDAANQTGSGYATQSANLTEILERTRTLSRVSVAYDTSCGSGSEVYDWDCSVNGSDPADSVVCGAFPVYASGAAPPAGLPSGSLSLLGVGE